jgi:hypothetical protein
VAADRSRARFFASIKISILLPASRWVTRAVKTEKRVGTAGNQG